jgi:hypothetical protein
LTILVDVHQSTLWCDNFYLQHSSNISNDGRERSSRSGKYWCWCTNSGAHTDCWSRRSCRSNGSQRCRGNSGWCRRWHHYRGRSRRGHVSSRTSNGRRRCGLVVVVVSSSSSSAATATATAATRWNRGGRHHGGRGGGRR